jgi:DNA-binding transcriptional ArsR family regulator
MALAKSQPSPTDLAGQGDMVIVLQALSDPVRLEIVRQIAGCDSGGELTCGELELPVTKSTGSHHLKILSAAGVIAEREEGTRKYLSLRRDELDRRFPGLLASVLQGAAPGPRDG